MSCSSAWFSFVRIVFALLKSPNWGGFFWLDYMVALVFPFFRLTIQPTPLLETFECVFIPPHYSDSLFKHSKCWLPLLLQPQNDFRAPLTFFPRFASGPRPYGRRKQNNTSSPSCNFNNRLIPEPPLDPLFSPEHLIVLGILLKHVHPAPLAESQAAASDFPDLIVIGASKESEKRRAVRLGVLTHSTDFEGAWKCIAQCFNIFPCTTCFFENKKMSCCASRLVSWRLFRSVMMEIRARREHNHFTEPPSTASEVKSLLPSTICSQP